MRAVITDPEGMEPKVEHYIRTVLRGKKDSGGRLVVEDPDSYGYQWHPIRDKTMRFSNTLKIEYHG